LGEKGFEKLFDQPTGTLNPEDLEGVDPAFSNPEFDASTKSDDLDPSTKKMVDEMTGGAAGEAVEAVINEADTTFQFVNKDGKTIDPDEAYEPEVLIDEDHPNVRYTLNTISFDASKLQKMNLLTDSDMVKYKSGSKLQSARIIELRELALLWIQQNDPTEGCENLNLRQLRMDLWGVNVVPTLKDGKVENHLVGTGFLNYRVTIPRSQGSRDDLKQVHREHVMSSPNAPPIAPVTDAFRPEAPIEEPASDGTEIYINRLGFNIRNFVDVGDPKDQIKEERKMLINPNRKVRSPAAQVDIEEIKSMALLWIEENDPSVPKTTRMVEGEPMSVSILTENDLDVVDQFGRKISPVLDKSWKLDEYGLPPASVRGYVLYRTPASKPTAKQVSEPVLESIPAAANNRAAVKIA
jgi:hypothetical protein